MVQFKTKYSIQSYYRFYIRYLMISRYNYIYSNTLPTSIQLKVWSEFPVNQLNQVPLSWTALSLLTADNPVKITKIKGSKKIKFATKHVKCDGLNFLVKIVHTLLMLKENLEIFTYSGKRKEPLSTINFQINDIPISIELEQIALSTQKKPFGNLKLNLKLSFKEDRIYVMENFWRCLNLPLERNYVK